MKRFENQKTTAKGIIANPYTKSFDAFEEIIPYTRSLQKALDFVREAMALDNDVMISVTELVQEKPKSINYDAQSLRDFASSEYTNENEAKKIATESQVVIPYTVYLYAAHVWAIDGANDYYTNFVEYESTVKHTKVNARAFIRMSYEKETGETVLAMHADKRAEETRYVVIDKDVLKDVKTRD